MMKKISDDDKKFFEEQMQGVKRIKTDKVILKERARPLKVRIRKEEIKNEDFPFSDHLSEEVFSETKLIFSRTGLQQKVLRSLRQGQIPFSASLDLHGFTVSEARTAISNFLQQNLEMNHRCLRIIHGKGGQNHNPPILKNQINNWLKQYPEVLAFCSALPKDGGNGAVYVLLKKN